MCKLNFSNTFQDTNKQIIDVLIFDSGTLRPLWLQINRSFCSKIKTFWYLIGVFIMNRILHGCLEMQNFSSHGEKYFTCLLPSLVEHFSITYQREISYLFGSMQRPLITITFLQFNMSCLL